MQKMRVMSLAALAFAMGSTAMAMAFPLTMEIENNCWRAAVEPETGTFIGPYQAASVTIKDADQVQRVLSNITALNELNGWADSDAGMHLVLLAGDGVMFIEPGVPQNTPSAAPSPDPAAAGEVEASAGATDEIVAAAAAVSGAAAADDPQSGDPVAGTDAAAANTTKRSKK